MHAHKAPPNSLASLPPCLVPQTSQGRVTVVDALGDQGSGQRAVGSIPHSLHGGVRVGRPSLGVCYRCQGAARAANGKAWA
jgi:hypothetical protein